MKILIMGASGMLGSSLFNFFSESPNFEVYGTIRPSAPKVYERNGGRLITLDDINDQFKLKGIISNIRPQVVINCIGMVKKFCTSQNVEQVIAVNSLFPHRLLEEVRLVNARLIHISTDCVFSGLGSGMYKENDLSDARDMYGLSKFLGEALCGDVVTIRTSIIGHEKHSKNGLIEWFLSQKESCNGYTKAVFSGFPTVILAKIIKDYIIANPQIKGLYHIASNPISKFHLLNLVASIYKKQVDILPSDEIVIDRSLCGDYFNSAVNFTPSGWSDMIEAMYDNDLKNNVSK